MIKIAIVTVNYNGQKDTVEFLESLNKLDTSGLETKVIVVDNGSSDISVLVIDQKFPKVDILQNGANEGFSGGYNRGMSYAFAWGADYILIINNDALIKDANLLHSLIKTFKTDESISIVSPKIYFAPGFEFHKDKYEEKDLGNVIWYAGGKFDWKNIMSIHRGLDEVDQGQFGETFEINFVTGCCMMIKTQALEKVKKPESGHGFFDDNLFLYFEDTDFTKRAKAQGFKTYYDGSVAIYHKASQTSGIGSEITDFFHTRNRLVLGFRYGGLKTRFALFREALKFLIFGRKAQKLGVWDFFMGKTGSSQKYIKETRKEEYQLELSICAVNYNTADLIKNLLQSIFNSNSGFNPKTMEIVVLDNGSDDNCSEVIKEFLPKIKFIQNKENEGFSKGYNKAISYSKGRYILLLNSDIEVLKNSLTELLNYAKEYKDNAVLGGKLYFPDKTNQDSVFNLPTLTGAFNEYFLGKKGSYFMYLPASRGEPDGEKPITVEGLVMACFLIPEKVLNKVGLLDEETFIFFEDIEYSRRLKKYGVPIYFIPTAKFIHHHGGSTKRIGQQKAYELLQKASKHYHGAFYYFLLTWILRIGQKLDRTKTPISRWTKS